MNLEIENVESKDEALSKKPVTQWSREEVGEWIVGVSNEKKMEANFDLKVQFIQNNIDGETLLKLDRELIRSLGITKVKDILSVEEAIFKIKEGISFIKLIFRKYKEKKPRR